jgi:hypothetical protein
MKKIILLTFLLIAAVHSSFAQNTIAKLKFEEAEEAYTYNNFELTLTKLKEVETLLKSTNPRILYLQILAQDKIISKDLMADYAIIENIRTSFNKYLKDYENLPDNEDKYRDIYKISETYKDAPISIQEFNELIKKKELNEAAKKTAENNEIKKGEEYFMSYVGCEFYEIGIPIETAKIKFPLYFNKYWVDKYPGENGYDSRYMSKKKEITVFIYGKNGRLVGYDRKALYGNVQSFVNDFTEKFKFSPTQRKFYQFLDYTWEKNGKKLTIRYDTKTAEIELRQFDSQNDNRWGDNPQDNAINPLKSENSNSTNNAINLLKSGNTNSANNTLNPLKTLFKSTTSENANSATNTSTSITDTSTLDEKAEYKKAKIDYKAGTISKDAYKEAIKKYGAYAAFESKRLQKAYQNKEITYSEYNEALKILLRK